MEITVKEKLMEITISETSKVPTNNVEFTVIIVKEISEGTITNKISEGTITNVTLQITTANLISAAIIISEILVEKIAKIILKETIISVMFLVIQGTLNIELMSLEECAVLILIVLMGY